MNPAARKAGERRVDGGHQLRGHGPVLRHSPEVHAAAAVGYDLCRVEARALEIRDESFAHEVALAGGHDGHARGRKPLQHLEVVADMVAMVVREQHEHRVGLLAGDVLDEPFLGRVLGRFRHAQCERASEPQHAAQYRAQDKANAGLRISWEKRLPGNPICGLSSAFCRAC
jgi:hypothetical protein